MFRNVAISIKIQIYSMILMVITAICLIISITYFSINDAVKILREELNLITVHRVKELHKYLEKVENDAMLMALNKMVIQSMIDFATSAPSENFTEELQELYIYDNDYPKGEKWELKDAKDGSTYSQYHSKYHPWFLEFQQRNHYHDLFLVTPKGDVVYSVFKEKDFATNLVDGKWANSGLAEAFQGAVETLDTLGGYSDLKPYEPKNGEENAFLSKAIKDVNGDILGVFILQIPLDQIANIVSDGKGLTDDINSFLINDKFSFLTQPRLSPKIKPLKDKIPQHPDIILALEETRKVEVIEIERYNNYLGRDVIGAFSLVNFFDTRHVFVIEAHYNTIITRVKKHAITLIEITLVLLVIMILMVRTFAKTLTRPILIVTRIMDRMSEGNYEDSIQRITDRKDEVGIIARSMDIFRKKMLIAKETEKKLKEKQHDERTEQFETLTTKFQGDTKNLLDDVSEIIETMKTENQSVSEAVQMTHDFSDEIATVAEHATQDVQLVASATSQMASSITEISEKMQTSRISVQKAAQSINKTDKIVRDMSVLSKGIDDIVTLINDIAEQTNLLALNATIEAARAGENGKGFAVVANEVKILATQTTKATENISTQITAIRDVSTQAVNAIHFIDNEIQTITKIFGSIATAVEQQATTAREITQFSRNASRGTIDASKKVNKISEYAQSTLQKSKSMSDYMGKSVNTITSLEKIVRGFLEKISIIHKSH